MVIVRGFRHHAGANEDTVMNTSSKLLWFSQCVLPALVLCSVFSGCSKHRSDGIHFELPDRAGWYAVVFVNDNGDTPADSGSPYVARFSEGENVIAVYFPFETGWAQDVFCINLGNGDCTPVHQLGYQIYADRVGDIPVSGGNAIYRAFYLGKAKPTAELPTEEIRHAAQEMVSRRSD